MVLRRTRWVDELYSLEIADNFITRLMNTQRLSDCTKFKYTYFIIIGIKMDCNDYAIILFSYLFISLQIGYIKLMQSDLSKSRFNSTIIIKMLNLGKSALPVNGAMRSFSTSTRRALATPVGAKPPHMKKFQIYRWVRNFLPLWEASLTCY